jgi:hypothetical protein
MDVFLPDRWEPEIQERTRDTGFCCVVLNQWPSLDATFPEVTSDLSLRGTV